MPAVANTGATSMPVSWSTIMPAAMPMRIAAVVRTMPRIVSARLVRSSEVEEPTNTLCIRALALPNKRSAIHARASTMTMRTPEVSNQVANRSPKRASTWLMCAESFVECRMVVSISVSIVVALERRLATGA